MENPYYQLFCGEEFFQHRLPLDRSSMTRWRLRMGDEKLAAQLVDEYYHEHHSIDDEMRMKLEIEYHMAVAAADAG